MFFKFYKMIHYKILNYYIFKVNEPKFDGKSMRNKLSIPYIDILNRKASI